MKHVLLVDDDSELLQSLARALSPLIAPYSLCASSHSDGALQLFEKEQPLVVVIDLCLDETRGVESGFELLKACSQLSDTIRILVLTGHGSIENGIRAIECGAASFLQKPVEPTHLAALIRDGISQATLLKERRELINARREQSTAALAGISSAVTRIREQVQFAASTSQAVLLAGETGTGKGVCARLIHDLGERKAHKFVPYYPNFGGGDLVQSELFGHLKGAFTGATDSRQGLVLEADGGTLFLDEIDELPPETQVRLLDVLQEKRIRPIGSNSFQSVDCRIIAATNKPLVALLSFEKLRPDLYHRIAHYTITLPPLRERVEDIPHLAEMLLQRFREREGVSVFNLSEEALRLLQGHPWPGNVRELQAVIEGAAYFARYQGRTAIESGDLRIGAGEQSERASGNATFSERIESYKVSIVKEALGRANGNQMQAAKELALDRGTLRRILSRN